MQHALTYSAGDFSGWAATFPPGDFSVLDLLSHGGRNDEGSSIKVEDAGQSPGGFTIHIHGGERCHNGEERQVHACVVVVPPLGR